MKSPTQLHTNSPRPFYNASKKESSSSSEMTTKKPLVNFSFQRTTHRSTPGTTATALTTFDLEFLFNLITMGNARSSEVRRSKKESPAPPLPTIVEEGSIFSDQSSRTGHRIILPPRVKSLERSRSTPHTSLPNPYHNKNNMLDDCSSFSLSTLQGTSISSQKTYEQTPHRVRTLPGTLPVVGPGETNIKFWTIEEEEKSPEPTFRKPKSEKWVTFEPCEAFHHIRHRDREDEKSKDPSILGPSIIGDKYERYTAGNDEKSAMSEDSWTLFKMSHSFEKGTGGGAQDEIPNVGSNTSSTIFDGVEDKTVSEDEEGLSLMDLSAAFFSVVNGDKEAIEVRPKREPGVKQNEHSGRVFKYLEGESRRGNGGEALRFLETAALVSELVLEQRRYKSRTKSSSSTREESQQLTSQFDDIMSAGCGDMASVLSGQSTTISRFFDDAMTQKLPPPVTTTREPTETIQSILEDLQDVDPRSIADFNRAIGKILMEMRSGDPRRMAERSANFFKKLEDSRHSPDCTSSAWEESKEGESKDEEYRGGVPSGPRQSAKNVARSLPMKSLAHTKKGPSTPTMSTSPPTSPATESKEEVNGRVEAHHVTIMKSSKSKTTKRSNGEAILFYFCCVRVDMILKRIASKESPPET